MLKKETGTTEGIFWICIGAIICLLALQFKLGSFHEPGPGFVAFLSGLFVSGIGLAMIISKTISMRRSGERSKGNHKFRITSWHQLIYTIGLLLAYIILIEPVGFIITTFMLMFGLLFDYKKRNFGWSLFFSIVIALASYITFEVWLRCQLPRGLFP